MAEFQQNAPPESVTNPPAAGSPKGAPFPCHVFKFGTVAGKHSLVVAYDGEAAITNAIQNIETAEELSKAKRDGWSEKPVLKVEDKKAAKSDDK